MASRPPANLSPSYSVGCRRCCSPPGSSVPLPRCLLAVSIPTEHCYGIRFVDFVPSPRYPIIWYGSLAKNEDGSIDRLTLTPTTYHSSRDNLESLPCQLHQQSQLLIDFLIPEATAHLPIDCTNWTNSTSTTAGSHWPGTRTPAMSSTKRGPSVLVSQPLPLMIALRSIADLNRDQSGDRLERTPQPPESPSAA